MKDQKIEQKSEKKEYAAPRIVDHGTAQSMTQVQLKSPSCIGGGPPTID